LSIWLIYICSAQALHPVRPPQAPLPHCSVMPSNPDMVTLSSRDTKEALELLPLSPACGPHSRLFEPSSNSGSDLFKDWPEANDMAVSVYVALTMDASSSRTSATNAPHGE
jgi:hypothetical protein